MIEMFTHPGGMPFAVALTIMGLLALLEILSTLFGTALSGLVDNLMPDLDFDLDIDLDLDTDLDIDTDVDMSGAGGAGNSLIALLSWLKVDQVPFLIVLVTFLASFGLLGLGLQAIVANVAGAPLKASLASIIALPLTLPVMRTFIGGLAKVLPQDETEVVSQESLVGGHAVIILGKATAGSPAEAKITDHFGTTHYVMVEPQAEGVELNQGQQVLLTARKKQTLFLAQAIELGD